MAVPLTRLEIGSLALPALAGAVAATWVASNGAGWALPLVCLAVILTAAIGYAGLAKAPCEADVEEIRRRLWLRYNAPGAASSTRGGEKLLAEAANLSETAPALAAAPPGEAGPVRSNGEAGGDRAIAYVERVIDRQINKLRGVLSFDALIIAFLSIERTRLPAAQAGADFATSCLFLIAVVLVLLVASSVMCLDLLRVRWPPPDNFTDFASEHRTTVKLVAERTRTIERAVRLAEVGVIGAVLSFFVIELGLPYFS
jgi:hypothetical protein